METVIEGLLKEQLLIGTRKLKSLSHSKQNKFHSHPLKSRYATSKQHQGLFLPMTLSEAGALTVSEDWRVSVFVCRMPASPSPNAGLGRTTIV